MRTDAPPAAVPASVPAFVPASLVTRGITGLTDNLPPGAGLDIARDFARVFRPEIEARLFGWKTSTPPRRGSAPAANQSTR